MAGAVVSSDHVGLHLLNLSLNLQFTGLLYFNNKNKKIRKSITISPSISTMYFLPSIISGVRTRQQIKTFFVIFFQCKTYFTFGLEKLMWKQEFIIQLTFLNFIRKNIQLLRIQWGFKVHTCFPNFTKHKLLFL